MNELTPIQNKIYGIRGPKVMLDRDLAQLYGVETRVLNQVVKRNSERFPDDFMFQLSETEVEDWKSQIVMSNSVKMGLRRSPYAFTELGVAMLSSVLNSKIALSNFRRAAGRKKSLCMKKLLVLSLFIIQTCLVFAQNCCENDSTFKEMQFPLTEQDTKTAFYYFNDEWIAEANPEMVDADSILKMEVKNDEYGNRAIFITISSEDLSKLKADVKEATKDLWVNYDPICEFPGGNGKLKEWLEANIRIPEGYKGNERVVVNFYVQPNGTVTGSKVIRPSKNEAANAEALRLVNTLPNFRVKFFTPKKHRIGVSLPIVFKESGTIYIRGNESE